MASHYFVCCRTANPFTGDVAYFNLTVELANSLSIHNIGVVQKRCDRAVVKACGGQYGNAIILNIIPLGGES